MQDAYEDARYGASDETALPISVFPDACPYSVEQMLDMEFLPDTSKIGRYDHGGVGVLAILPALRARVITEVDLLATRDRAYV